MYCYQQLVSFIIAVVNLKFRVQTPILAINPQVHRPDRFTLICEFNSAMSDPHSRKFWLNLSCF